MTVEPKQIEEIIRSLEDLKARGLMAAEQADASIAALKAQLAGNQANLQGEGAIAQGAGAKALGQNAVLVEGNFQGSIYMGKDPKEEEKQLAIYRRWVMQTTANLPLRGVDVNASDPTQAQKAIGLANVYVDLDTTKRYDEENLVQVVIKGKPSIEPVMTEKSVSVLESVIANRHTVLLGDPGSGKSTFVNFLAHCLAAHRLDSKAGWLEHLQGWPEDETDLLPIPVTLRDFARGQAEKLPAKAEPQHLWDFIVARLETQNLGFAAELLKKALDSGHALVLLDGLDEVPGQAQRLFVREAVRSFIGRYGKSRFLITCRVLSYQPPKKGRPDLRLSELPDFTIAPFDDEKIKLFVAAWYAELARLDNIPTGEQETFTARLREALRRPDLRRLAPNPLLLTVMALVHTHKGRLPDARALLYEETIEILLWRWEQIKLGGQEDALRLRQLLREAGRTDVDLKRVLWELAYGAHAASKGEEGGDTLADIPEHRMLKALAALKCDEDNPEGDLSWARQLVDLMKLRAGLLLERQPEVFTFPHRTFQEYLAGAHLAAQSDFARRVAGLARKDSALWREAILYGAGRLVYVSGDVEKPLALVAELCPDEEQDTDTDWKLAWLGGNVLNEIGSERARDSAFGQDLLKRAKGRIKNLLEGGKLAPVERARAGGTLAALGDPRFDPNHWFLPKDETLGFVQISGSEFSMGSGKGEGFDDERPQHKVTLADFWMAKYPVTVGQFHSFVAATGYQDFHPDALRDPDNRPVRFVNWYEALEYCKWLEGQLSIFNDQLQESSGWGESERAFWQGLKEGRLHVCLPSEAEWEKAARGEDGREYPWGKGIDPQKANYGDTGIGETCSVGCFPAGASPHGVLDMSGNVWEWTRSLWGNDYLKPQFKYPYHPGDKMRENLAAPANTLRILRGGSFGDDSDYARCASRLWDVPNLRYLSLGFRVVVSPFLPS